MKWTVFDYGEVIGRRTTAIPELAATLGVEVTAFEAQYWAGRDAYDRGSTDFDYWSRIGEVLGIPVDQAAADELTSIDIAGWLHADPATLELLAALDEAGSALALLSNAPVSFARAAERQDWTRHFRATMFSGDLDCAKPDTKIFTALLSQLGAEPGDCLFFDDRQSNVDGARAAGLKAHRWSGVDTARGQLV